MDSMQIMVLISIVIQICDLVIMDKGYVAF